MAGRARGDREAPRGDRPLAAPIRIAPSDRIFIAGTNGSGKSYLATSLARRWDRSLTFDPKDEPEVWPPNATIARSAEAARRALPGRVVYVPPRAEMADIAEHFDRIVARAFDLGSHAVVIHELASLANGNRVAPALLQAITQGRTHAVPMVLVTQRPIDIPRVAITESRHFFLFRLEDPRDRAVLAGVMGPAVRAEIPLDHSFWYRDPSGALARCRPVR